ncbi:mycothiol synthase [Cryptosporangium aurantiacum]|uniref:Mycothiol acetyltransferase n=1 Tax=Cryptosporangium aurantiacum TaxID=134849 RepID=A0A1M7RHB1_9ACTN|nr:mycothiol synthase [Cryptosporangium aurantiacum]SHN45695.1 mycothiol synthase [Cryptosporangium aurantiacum]
MATGEFPGPAEIKAVLALNEAATATDGVGPLSEQTILALKNPAEYPDVVHLFAREGDEIAGYAQVAPGDPASGEVVVHPAARGQGFGRRLVESALAAAHGPLAIWAHGEHPAAVALAGSLGLQRSRVLSKMCRSLERPLPPVRLPDDVRLRSFVVGADDAAWLRVNARAFASHPEQGKWTQHDLEVRQREPWFDAAGFLLAVRGDDVLGYHWTKRELSPDGTPGPEGEVYVVGVDPDAQGLRLGTALTIAGLEHLARAGATEGVLYVDESNERAVRVYAGLGFEVCETHVMYSNR